MDILVRKSRTIKRQKTKRKPPQMPQEEQRAQPKSKKETRPRYLKYLLLLANKVEQMKMERK